MGGKKGPEKNRQYEKDRRDRLNNQFHELSQLLPDFNSSVIKVTKTEIISRTIQYLQDIQSENKKTDNDFECDKTKISELQNRVTSLLQIIEELIRLLRKLDVNFPTSLPLDDFTSFKEAYVKCKRKTKENDSETVTKKKKHENCDSDSSNHEFPESSQKIKDVKAKSIECTETTISTHSPAPTVAAPVPVKSTNTTVMNLETPGVLRLDSNSLILPSANILTVNGLSSNTLNPVNNSQTLLLNKQIAVPTFILMQNNNLIPVCSVQQVTVPQQRLQKLIVPKQTVMSTKTTFINKKPIPAVCLYKSSVSNKEDKLNKSANSINVKRKKSKRSKGILVKYPKRKPPSKKKLEAQKVKPQLASKTDKENKIIDKTFTTTCNEKSAESDSSFNNIENCYTMNENNFNENNDINKEYSCNENLFESSNQNTSEFSSKNVQFIDFFENNSRSLENNNESQFASTESQFNNDETQFHDSETQFDNNETQFGNSEENCEKMEKSVENGTIMDINYKNSDNFNEHLTEICSVKNSYVDQSYQNNALESATKETQELKENADKTNSICINKSVSQVKSTSPNYHHLPTSCHSNDSLLLKFVPHSGSSAASNNHCTKNYQESVPMETAFDNSLMKEIDKNSSTDTELSKRKSIDKEITPLTIHCNLSENKSISKELSLSLMDEKKHYDSVSTFDEFSNDLFTSLQVPASGQNTDSISPTAAFLLTFPLVSSCKNVDLLPEHEPEEDGGNVTTTSATTILQIGNLESPSTLLFTSSKFSKDSQKSGEKLNFPCNKPDDSIYSSTFCSNILPHSELNSDNSLRKEKNKECKENDVSKQYMPIGRSDAYNLNDVVSFNQSVISKNNCTNKESTVSQNMPFYPPSSTSSTFPSYNIFTKYNDIPAVTGSYYSLGSQPFPVSKSVTVDPITDFNSWVTVPSIYNQEVDTTKEKTKRDKCTSTHSFKNTKLNDFSTNISAFGLSSNDLAASVPTERPKVDKVKKPQKQTNARLVNWMTSPDLRNTTDSSHSITDNFLLQKDDSMGANNFINSPNIPNVQNNSAFNVSYSSTDYFIDNQTYTDSQMNNCKVTYSSSNPTSYSWSPSKTTLPTLPHLDTHNMMIPSTLPTLVGDLALGNTNSTGPMDKIFNTYDVVPKKFSETEKPIKRDTCKNFYKNDRIPINNEYTKSNSQSSFLSVTQLVDDKDHMTDGKNVNKSKNNEECQFDNDKCNYVRGKENYGNVMKTNDNTDFKKSYTNANSCNKNKSDTNMKNTQIISVKCKTKELKYNVNLCLAKENKKDSRNISSQNHQKPFNDYVSPQTVTCDNMLNKNMNPLSNKNSNYSAESLIGSTNQNSCPSQNYFPYDNSTNYANCSSNDYSRRRIETNETESSLSNVGYYTNTNYVYPNNFQSFNNYGFSNQCYNNYPSQIQPAGLQKKSQKEDGYNKQDTDWYKESFPPHYNSIGDFVNQNKTDKCKQSFPNVKYNAQKNSNNSNINNTKYYNYNPSVLPNNTKSSCSFNTSYTFSQSSQQCSETSCLAPNYDVKTNRNNIVNSSNAHTATSLTNFNLSAIFPEINDKHCSQNRINPIINEKKDSNYGNKINIDEMSYNYLIQPSSENNSDPVSVYGSSSFQIQHYPDFTPRKTQK